MHRDSGLLGYFDFILTREDYAASKPDPEPYRTACARSGLHPGRCLAIEDSERGVISAARAGLVVAAIPGDMNRGVIPAPPAGFWTAFTSFRSS
jgi:HAD superfamily hydrolase (TIGR01509 family)